MTRLRLEELKVCGRCGFAIWQSDPERWLHVGDNDDKCDLKAQP